MKTSKLRLLVVLLSTMLTLGCSSPMVRDKIAYKAISADVGENSEAMSAIGSRFPSGSVMTDVELQEQLQAYTDRYIQRIVQVADDAIRDSEYAAEREVFNLFKATAAASAVSIATSPNPLIGLRDMRVMVRLQQLVWSKGGPKSVTPQRSGEMHRILALLEEQIIILTAQVVPKDAVDMLTERIDAWHQANPEQTSVAFIRFHNLDLPDNGKLDRLTTSGGLLAPVAEAAREMNEARKMADRALFLANHMPMVVQLRGELLARRVLGSSEAENYLSEAKALRETLQGIVKEAQQAQKSISHERQAIQDELMLYRPIMQSLAIDFSLLPDHVARERKAIFDALDAGSVAYQPMLNQMGGISTASRDAASSLERMLNTLNSKGMTVEQFSALLDKMLLITEHASSVTGSLDALLGPNAKPGDLEALDARLVSHERRLFGYAAALMALLAALLVAVRMIWLKMTPSPK